MTRLAVVVLIATGLTGCGWMHRDRETSGSSMQSGYTADPAMQGTGKEMTKNPAQQQKRMQEQQDR
jgi:hypothetical protein